jgi:tetratricopeptide (TPR) repeat protein
MIVKNEAPVITRCLSSVKQLIDYWVIVDTGSTDGTQEIIKQSLKDIPGELHERPWKDFAHNRNEALALAKGKGDYILIIDADDTVDVSPTFAAPHLTCGSYRLLVRLDDLSFQRDHLIASSLPWKWIGVVHEALTCDEPHTTELLSGLTYRVGHGGARERDPQTYRNDITILEEALREEPTNGRTMFYLALTHKTIHQYEEAVTWFQKRIELGGNGQEVFWSAFQLALCESMLSKPHDIVINSFLKAHHLRPHRAEPVFYLAFLYRSLQRYDEAYSLLQAYRATPKPASPDILIGMEWCERWGVLCELSANAYLSHHYHECLEASDILLTMNDLPESLRQQAHANKEAALEQLYQHAAAS